MDHVTIDLKNCYGIKNLQHDFDFSETRAFAIYAPNGVMKSSLAQTFQDVSSGKMPEDRLFPARETAFKIIDEDGNDIAGDSVLVVLPYDDAFGITEQTSTLLLDPELKAEYDELLRATAAAKATLLEAIKTQATTKKDMESEISSAIMPSSTQFDDALNRLRREVEEQKDTVFSSVHYDKFFMTKWKTH